MTTFADSYFQAKLYERMDEEHQTRGFQLIEGFYKTYEEYRERVGYLRALRDVRAWGDEIMTAVQDNGRRDA
ncbi:MAG TPA: hypothetical protein VH024_17410 [Candidatus Angelobacter sp.]|jgi:hypothetical protein|nr:hypothetical protein [Candidatus Angelobacter sp.]